MRIKTKSSPKATGYNELIMDDLKDKELIRMHAQRNHQIKVLRSESRTVGMHQVEVIDGARGVKIDGETKLDLKEADEIGDVGEKGEWEKELGDVLQVKSNRYVEIGKEQDVKCELGHHLHVVDGDVTTLIDEGNLEETLKKGNHTTTLEDGNVEVKASQGTITLDASDKIVLKCGESSIELTPMNITLKNGSTEVELDATNFKAKTLMAKIEGSGKAELGSVGMTKGDDAAPASGEPS